MLDELKYAWQALQKLRTEEYAIVIAIDDAQQILTDCDRQEIMIKLDSIIEERLASVILIISEESAVTECKASMAQIQLHRF
jgi:hypothetical protein